MRLLLIIVLVGGLFVVVVGGGLAWFWWSRHGEELMGAGKSAHEEGARRGETATEAQCLEEAVARRRARANDLGFETALSTSLFLLACLDAAQPTPGFCDGVPRSMDVMRSIRWQTERCRELGFSDPQCGSFLSNVQKHCESKGKAAAP